MKRSWLSSGVCLPLLMGALLACGEGPVAVPTSPVVTPVMPADPLRPGAPLMVSGLVVEHALTGAQPLPGVRLRVRIAGAFLETTSDGTGHYEVSGIPVRSAIVIAPSSESGYRAPCPNGHDVLIGNATFDVHVVSAALLSTTGVPTSLPRTSIWVAGVVVEQTSGGVRPIAGAAVDLASDDSDASVNSSTLTDAEGRYLLCTSPPGVGTDQLAWVRVRKNGYRLASRSVLMGGGDPMNVALIRD